MMNKKKPRDILSPAQYQINRRAQADMQATHAWLCENGVTADVFYQLPPEIAQAQRVAHMLLTHHAHMLTPQQTQTLETFQHQLRYKKSRTKLRVQSAYPVLNIGTKINRQLFRQHRQLNH